MTDIAHPHRQTFESIRHENEGAEYWLARQLAPVLGYEKYDNFLQVVRKARVSCVQAGLEEADHLRRRKWSTLAPALGARSRTFGYRAMPAT
ncbi:hypothetical protein [Brevundimonas denitrificans]|uniref:hypothetical protein n=1 Tax=Brevundimonas denitrificans TaxID=1443434 RepID=UPI00223ADB6F|nr:hypothetical protein [Brevundimonas denitrificans]